MSSATKTKTKKPGKATAPAKPVVGKAKAPAKAKAENVTSSDVPATAAPEVKPDATPAPEAAPKAVGKRKARPKAGAKPKPLSCLDAAVVVLRANRDPMPVRAMIDVMRGKGLWTSGAPTPWATLYSAIIREIGDKGDASRFAKADRGLFALNPKHADANA
jgi:hypothetical protein